MFTFDDIFSFFRNKDHGGVKDIYDPRDLRYEEISGDFIEADSATKFLLDTVQLRVKKQGRTSSCGCQAASFAVGMSTGEDMSARYAFNVIKTDSRFESSLLKWGMFTRDAAKIAVEGICLEGYAPEEATESDSKYLSLPITTEMMDNATNHKRKAYVRVDGIFGNDFELVKRFIYTERLPVLVSMPWYTNYNEASFSGVIPSPKGKSVGHIVLCIGWEDDNYVMVNSYGKDWGNDGTFLMHRMYTTWDCWGIIGGKDISKPPKISKRDIEKEKEKAMQLQTHMYRKFAVKDSSRSVAGKNWLLLVNAITYRGYTDTDIENWCYAVSRGKTPPFDLSKNK